MQNRHNVQLRTFLLLTVSIDNCVVLYTIDLL